MRRVALGVAEQLGNARAEDKTLFLEDDRWLECMREVPALFLSPANPLKFVVVNPQSSV
jgi:hypothetical protein